MFYAISHIHISYIQPILPIISERNFLPHNLLYNFLKFFWEM